MATFNIYGTCICRDLFGFVDDDKHEVLGFLQSSSPIVNFKFDTKPQNALTEESFENVNHLTKFQKKCIRNDYNKTLLSYYEKKSDFFIIDLVQMANTNLVAEEQKNGEEHYFTHSKWFGTAFDEGLSKYIKGKIRIINRLKLLDKSLISEVIDRIVLWLNHMGYRNEQIICIENKRAFAYEENGHLRFFEEGNRSEVNDLLDDIYESFKQRCKGCYYIPMLVNTFCDVNHKWGLTDLHFCQEYYDYLFKSIDLIVDGHDAQSKINRLYRKYDALFSDNIRRLIKDSISLTMGQQMIPGFKPSMTYIKAFSFRGKGFPLFSF